METSLSRFRERERENKSQREGRVTHDSEIKIIRESWRGEVTHERERKSYGERESHAR